MNSHKQGIGIFGGTFDPIHLGHTKSAQAVATQLNLNKVLLIPAHIPPHKSAVDLIPHANAQQRAAMVEIACKHNTLFVCDSRELHRPGHSYTVDTLKDLKHEFPNQPLYFIIGMDSLITFTQWHKYQEILTLCHLVVNTRPNYSIDEINEQTRVLLKLHQLTDIDDLTLFTSGKILFAHKNLLDISSTQIREKLAQHQPCDNQLLPKISEFINKNKLYR
jgi:nicotinate-nucleotide adenylyltransferase